VFTPVLAKHSNPNRRLTDLCCHSYPEPPDYPVLWATDSRKTAPFGETVQINSE